MAQTNNNKNTTKARRLAAAAMLACAFAAIMVHGRTSRAVQSQAVKTVAVIEAFERPNRV